MDSERRNPAALLRRRWLRFRLRSLLLFVTMVAVLLAAWRWVTWPQRTLRELESLVAEGHLEAAEAHIVFEPDYHLSAASTLRLFPQGYLVSVPRTWADLFSGREHFRARGTGEDGIVCWVQTGPDQFTHHFLESATVEKGILTVRWGENFREWSDKELARLRAGGN